MDDSKDILILGGYGKAGTCIADLLIRYSNHAITLAGRNLTEAQKVTGQLKRSYESKRIYSKQLDLSNINNLIEVISQYDILIVCSPFPKDSSDIVEAIVNANIHYIDIAPDKNKNIHFKSFQDTFVSNGKTCLLEAGWEPGLPALLVRLADQNLGDRTRDVKIHAVYRDREMSLGSISDIMEHTNFTVKTFQDKRWKKTSMLNMTLMDFPDPWGRMIGYPTELNELQELPQKCNFNQLELYQGGYNWLFDAILFVLTAIRTRKGSFLFDLGVKLTKWANLKFTSPDSAGLIKVMAASKKVSVTVIASNTDLYRATAIPVVASVLLMEDKKVKPGVGFMGHKLPSQKMVDIISRMGISISYEKEIE